VLNAQQALVNSRVALVTAQHDRVVASYAVLSAVGRLSPRVLHLATPILRPPAFIIIRCVTTGSAFTPRTAAESQAQRYPDDAVLVDRREIYRTEQRSISQPSSPLAASGPNRCSRRPPASLQRKTAN